MSIDSKILNIAAIWTGVSATAAAIVYVFTTFATAADLEEYKQATAQAVAQLKADTDASMTDFKLNQALGQYYDRLDDYEEALQEGRDGLAEEYLRQMERLKTIICKIEPEWDRCDE